MRIRQIGRLFYEVESESRRGVTHICDYENNAYGPNPACSCEQNRIRGKKCKHLREVDKILLENATRSHLTGKKYDPKRG